MSEVKEMVLDVVEKIFKNKIEKETVDLLEENKWAGDVWHVLLENELHNVAVSEENGGAGGDIEDLLALYTLVGKYAAPVPFLEHTLANFLLQTVGASGYEQLTTYHLTTPLALTADKLSGTLQHVAWAQYAEQLVTVAKAGEQAYVVVVSVADCERADGTNLAAEPRSKLTLKGARVQQKVAITEQQLVQLQKFVTAASVSKMSGALSTAFQLSVQFSKEREQFGRPIHRFQLVQQHLAILAGEETLMTVATANMQQLLAAQAERDEVAYARLRMDDASRIVATSAHQVHAAIGVTHEHRLHQFTRRLWAWRDEDFTANFWKKQLAQAALTSANDLWEILTAQHETETYV